MFHVHLIFIVLMAIDTGKFIKIRTPVTIQARRTLVRTRKNRELVFKNSLGPGPGFIQVAFLTIRMKSRLLMIRVRGIVVIIQVAGDAITRDIIPPPMTGTAIQSPMGAFQRPETVMIYVRPIPIRRTRAVAYFAIRGIPRLDMIGINRALVLFQVAGHTLRRGPLVQVVFMTIAAVRCFVHTVKRKQKMKVLRPLP